MLNEGVLSAGAVCQVILISQQSFAGLHQTKSFLLASFGKMQMSRETPPVLANPEALHCLFPHFALQVCNMSVFSIWQLSLGCLIPPELPLHVWGPVCRVHILHGLSPGYGELLAAAVTPSSLD